MSSNAQATAHVGSKRNRRLRSNAGANAGGDTKRGKTKPDTSKVPIFLRKTYDMIDSCDPAIASWTEDGDMFVVKNQSIFEKTVIPKYFDHSKFSSFNRQLNFYGFRKIQAKPIRNEDIDQETLKHITFYNENFKRGHRDLMIKIQRSTKTGGNLNAQEQQKEIEALKQKVVTLETQVHQLYQIISSGYAMNGAGPTATATASAAVGSGGAAGGYGGVPMEVGGQQPSPQAQEYYERPGSGHMSEENINDNSGGGVPTSIAVHGQPPSFHPDHNMAPERISSNGEVDRKQPPSTDNTMLTSMATPMNNNNNNSATHNLTPPDKKATLPRHPNAKGGLPNEMPDLPAELERGVSSLSLLRGLSSGYDPNLSMGFLTRGVTLTGVSIAPPPPNGNLKGGGGGPQGDTTSGGSGGGGGARGGGGGGHDPNDPMLSNFDKKFFNTLINETSGGGGTGDGGSGGSGGGGGGIRVSNTAAGRKENDGESGGVGIKNDLMINSKQV